jgi:hypothetical protein
VLAHVTFTINRISFFKQGMKYVLIYKIFPVADYDDYSLSVRLSGMADS